MYDESDSVLLLLLVTGPCEFLVMYDETRLFRFIATVTGPCEFLVMYDFNNYTLIGLTLQDPVNF